MTRPGILLLLREWTRRVWDAASGRQADHDLQRELAGHLALAEDEFRRRGHAPSEAARLAGLHIPVFCAGGLDDIQHAGVLRDYGSSGLTILTEPYF